MTFLLHGAIPATIVWKSTGNIPLTIVSGFVGTIPDIVNNKYYHILPYERVYNKLHRPWLWLKKWTLAAVMAVYLLLWPAGLHVIMDYPVHTDDDNTRNIYWYAWIETICWFWIFNAWGIIKIGG